MSAPAAAMLPLSIAVRWARPVAPEKIHPPAAMIPNAVAILEASASEGQTTAGSPTAATTSAMPADPHRRMKTTPPPKSAAMSAAVGSRG